MNLEVLPTVYAVDAVAIRQRVPADQRETVLAAIEQAMRTLPLDPSKREPLVGNLAGLFKCKFSSGLLPGELGMRLAILVDEVASTVQIWAAGFRDANLPRDFYDALLDRVVVERSMGNDAARHIGGRGSSRRRR